MLFVYGAWRLSIVRISELAIRLDIFGCIVQIESTYQETCNVWVLSAMVDLLRWLYSYHLHVEKTWITLFRLSEVIHKSIYVDRKTFKGRIKILWRLKSTKAVADKKNWKWMSPPKPIVKIYVVKMVWLFILFRFINI